jgi:hypothetical protein
MLAWDLTCASRLLKGKGKGTKGRGGDSLVWIAVVAWSVTREDESKRVGVEA